ncbi:M42 family metallopeptidase [Deinococcus aquiradiocola]|uniref:Peptidase M28 n=1 Tax=Deinococcus aquiradiocola TaxID=393059 RepID=A0A917PAW2_9DEIO|nr:M42 family metallopeptidase [Deinococcus aquiradiocola]GGJ69093.1 peptidase M28 [Deinococcus aquiradiocola]
MTDPFQALLDLSNLNGVPGREDAVRDYVLAALQGLADDVRVDAMGNVIAYRQGRDAPEGQTRERVMLSAHMDEIGFIVRYIDDTGYLRLQALGGFDTRNLFARNVTVHTRTTTLPGILSPGGRPIHISTPEDRKKVPEMREFFVDLGLSVDDVKRQVRVGDMVTLDQTARQVGHLIVGKAMDDRASVYMQLEVLRRLDGKPRHDVYAVFSTQEEVGLRGAITAAYSVQPTIGVALDVTLAVDTPGVGPDEAVTRMGQGIGIKVYDSTMISTRWLVDDFADLADREGIPYQLEVLSLGGTDGAAIQRSRDGVPTVTLSLPTRYIHSVVESVHVDDLKAGTDLLLAYLR